MKYRWLFVIALLLALPSFSSAEWTTYKANSARTAYLDNATNLENLKYKWNVTTGDQIMSSPIIDGGVAYIGSTDGKVYAINRKTGAQLWSNNVLSDWLTYNTHFTNKEDGPYFWNPRQWGLGNGVVKFGVNPPNSYLYVTSNNAGVGEACSSYRGDPYPIYKNTPFNITFKATMGMRSTIQIARQNAQSSFGTCTDGYWSGYGGNVYLGSPGSDSSYPVLRCDGTAVNGPTYSTGCGGGGTSFDCPATVWVNFNYPGTGANYTITVWKDGTTTYTKRNCTISGTFSTDAVVYPYLNVEHYYTMGRFINVDLMNFTSKVPKDGKTLSTLTSTPDLLLAGTSNNSLIALDKTTGSVMWNVQLDTNAFGDPAVDGNKIFISTLGRLYAIYTNGTIAWNFTADMPQNITLPAIKDNRVYIGTVNTLYSLVEDTGAIDWSQKLNNAGYFYNLSDHFTVSGGQANWTSKTICNGGGSLSLSMSTAYSSTYLYRTQTGSSGAYDRCSYTRGTNFKIPSSRQPFNITMHVRSDGGRSGPYYVGLAAYSQYDGITTCSTNIAPTYSVYYMGTNGADKLYMSHGSYAYSTDVAMASGTADYIWDAYYPGGPMFSTCIRLTNGSGSTYCSMSDISGFSNEALYPYLMRATWSTDTMMMQSDYMILQQNYATPIAVTDPVVGAMAYISYNQTLYALNTTSSANPRIIWTYNLTTPILSSPALSNDTLYLGGQDNILYAIDAFSGIQKWNYTTGGQIKGSPSATQTNVLVGTLDNKLYVLNASTGEALMNITVGDDLVANPAISADGTMVIFTSLDNRTYGYSTLDYIPSIAVSPISSQNPVQGNIAWVNCVSRVSDMNTSTVGCSFTNGATTRQNTSCSYANGNVSCAVPMYYYDLPGTWTVNASGMGLDNLPYADNSTFTYNPLSAISIAPSTIAFGSLSIGATQGASTDPLVVYNQGNTEFTNISIRAYDLKNGTYVLPASIYSANTVDSMGVNMSNGTYVQVPSAALPVGSTEEIYLWVQIPNTPPLLYKSQSNWVVAALN